MIKGDTIQSKRPVSSDQSCFYFTYKGILSSWINININIYCNPFLTIPFYYSLIVFLGVSQAYDVSHNISLTNQEFMDGHMDW